MSQPRFVSPLSEETRQQLNGLHRTGRSHRVRQRAHAVRLSAKGYTLDQIADVLDVDRDAVSRTLDRWEEGGLAAWRKEVVRAARPKWTPPWRRRCSPPPKNSPPACAARWQKGGVASGLLRHVKEGVAPGALALAAHASAHGQAAHPAPGARGAQSSLQAARPRAGGPL